MWAGGGARCAGWLVDGVGVGRTADRPGEILASKTADKGRAVWAYTGRGCRHVVSV